MQFDLYKGSYNPRNLLFIRPATTHWWITGFRPSTEIVNCLDLTMVGSITFPSRDVAKAFMRTVKPKPSSRNSKLSNKMITITNKYQSVIHFGEDIINETLEIFFCSFRECFFLLTGCRPDYEQALDNMQATQRLVSAVVHPNYDAIQEAATEGANMNRIWVNGAFTSPILCVWQTTPRPLFLEQMLKNGSDVNYADRTATPLLMYASGYEPQKYGFLPGKGNYSSDDYAKLFLRYDADGRSRIKKVGQR